MPARKLKEYLESHNTPYQVLAHPRAYTSQGVAAATHVSGSRFAKCVILRTGEGKLIMTVIPGPRHVNLDSVRELLGARDVELAKEEEFQAVFTGCELGAEPPFGNLYDLPVYVDTSLAEEADIIFNAGTHTETIRMRFSDFESLVHPVLAPLSRAA